MNGIGSHTKPNKGATDEWLTPPEIIQRLGPFDLDPCTPIEMPWTTAAKRFTVKENGLMQNWNGRVWLNPPYGAQTGLWLKRIAAHGNGIALIFARTETKMFFEYVWKSASAVLFLEGRLFFHYPSGLVASANSGGPSCLVAYGHENAWRLAQSGIRGALATAFCTGAAK